MPAIFGPIPNVAKFSGVDSTSYLKKRPSDFSSDDVPAASELKRVKIESPVISTKPKAEAKLKAGVKPDDPILRNPLVYELPIRIPAIDCRLYAPFSNPGYRPELDWGEQCRFRASR